MILWVRVWPYLGTRIRLLRAFSTAFWIASGTSRALPYPIPTTPSSSPTATSAVNENRRPPLTTLATRLISITRSWRSSPRGLTVSTFVVSIPFIAIAHRSGSEAQASLARPLGEGADAAVVLVAAAVEHAGLDPGLLRPAGQKFARLFGLVGGAEHAQLGLGPVDRRHGVAGAVVDQLGEYTAVGAVDREARTLGAADDTGPDPPASAQAMLSLG